MLSFYLGGYMQKQFLAELLHDLEQEMLRLGYTKGSADTEMKRKALENVHPDLIDSNLPDWNKDQALLSWLSELK